LDKSKPKWELNSEAFEAFLALLDSDRDVAGERYNELREKLIRYFEWRQAARPEELADETINRVCRRIEDGEKVEDVHKYAFGVARFVLMEYFKAPIEEELPVESNKELPAIDKREIDENEAEHECLRKCLLKLSVDERDLILRYYENEGMTKIDDRKRMAAELGVTQDNLRQIAKRIRKNELGPCVQECLEKAMS